VLHGFVQLLLGRAEHRLVARQDAIAARSSLAERGGTAREWRLVQALDHWIVGDMGRCADCLDDQLRSEALDALSFKVVYALRFMLGDLAGMWRAVQTVAPVWTAETSDYGFLLGCGAFVLEEAGALSEAERYGRLALEYEPQDAWAYHAVAHVYETQGNATLGLRWFADRRARAIGVNNFARHLAWHEALYRLARREIDAVLQLYDDEIRDIPTDDYRDIANAASLLRRLEQHCIPVGQRWDELADLAERRIGDVCLVFAGLHDLLCLIGGQRWEAAQEFVVRWRRAGAAGLTQAHVAVAVGLPLAQLMLALARDDNAIGIDFAVIRRELPQIGGSAAQRQIFALMLAEAAPSCALEPRAA
jgi:tetratricopeptide (TPR) repeat protein